MKKIISFLLLLPFLAACAAPASVPAQTSVIENTVSPTFTPIPTFTVEAQTVVQPPADLPTLTPPAVQSGLLNIIQFNVNSAYADITDSIAAGSSKTYLISAIQGQMMSISILPQIPEGDWGYIPMQIKGADGSILCPQVVDYDCIFWRGALPSSQDYFVTLTPTGDVLQFVMRVAINPPGKDAQYFHYNNAVTGLSLTYPDSFAPAIPAAGNYKINPELTLQFIDSKTYEKTNLSEVYLFVSSTTDAQVVAACTSPNQNGGGPEQVIGNEVINGFTFTHSVSEGAGAGNYYEQEIYRMVHKNICYEVIYFIHSSNIGNYPPGVVAEFDRNAILQKLDDVFSTFTIE